MRLDDLRHELRAIADEAPPSTRTARAVARPAVRRRWTRRILAGAVVVAVVAGALATLTHDPSRSHHLSIEGSGPAATAPGLSAATIADGRWRAMASFPLEARSGESVIWTGSQMIVWGGHLAEHALGDGAAYDPDTDTWRTLPAAPIAARTEAAAVWTGREMIVWGGDRRFVGNFANDGAAFDPVAWKWRRIAASPLAPRYSAGMVWTGTEAIVIGGYQTNSGELTRALDAAAYNPGTDRWRQISSLPGVSGAAIKNLSFVWTGNQLLVWELWSRTTNTLRSFGLQLVEYDPSADAWKRGPEPDDPHRNVYAPLWTGTRVLVPAAFPLCNLPDGAETCGPPATDLHGSEFDPATGAFTSIPHGPVDDGAVASVWTGDDLVVMSAGTVNPANGKVIEAPGSVAAWDPRTGKWTRLPRPPFADTVGTMFWTGQELLVWTSGHGMRYQLALPGSTTPSTTPSTTTRPEPSAIPDPVATQQAQVPLDQPNEPVAVGNGKVFVGTTRGVSVFDPVTVRRVGQIPTPQPVLEIASSPDGVWLISGCTDNFGVTATPPLRLERIDPATLQVEFSTVLPGVGAGDRASGFCRYEHLRLAAASGAAWVAFGPTVLRIDARTGALTPVSLSGRYVGNIAADDSGLWVETNGTDGAGVEDEPLLHIDATTNAVTTIHGLPSGFYWSVATTGKAAWTVAAVDSGSSLQLTRIDAVTHALTRSRINGIALVAGDGQLWVQIIPPTGGSSLNYRSLIGQIDTKTGQIARTVTISIGEEPGSSGDGYPSPPFAVANGSIWSAYNGLQRTTPGAVHG